MQAARREREHSWSVFAARYGFELFNHAHQACYGARGRLDGLDLTVAEQLEGSEFFAAQVLPEALELVLCDKDYWQWCRDPARIYAQEKAVRVGDRIHRKLREPAPSPGLMAVLLPHAATPRTPATGNPIFDDRFVLLFADTAASRLAPVADSFVALPGPVILTGIKGSVRAVFPTASALEDQLLRAFISVASSLGRLWSEASSKRPRGT